MEDIYRGALVYINLIGFMNHVDTKIIPEKTGQTTIYGANGAGKSAIQEGLSFIESDSRFSRFSSWKEAFKHSKEGSVEIGVYDESGRVVIFKKTYKNSRYRYYVNNKHAKAAIFYKRLLQLNIRFNASNMIRQGQVATKFNGKGVGTLRDMLERITGDDKIVSKYYEICETKKEIEKRIEACSKELGEMNSKAFHLKEQIEILDEYDRIGKKLNGLKVKILITEFLNLLKLKEELCMQICILKRKLKRKLIKITKHKDVSVKCTNKINELKREYEEIQDSSKKLYSQLSVMEALLNNLKEKNKDFDDNEEKIPIIEWKANRVKKRVEYITNVFDKLQQKLECVIDDEMANKYEELIRQKELFEKEISEREVELEQLKNTEFNESKYKAVDKKYSELLSLENGCEEKLKDLQVEYDLLRSKRTSYPKKFTDFENYLKKRGVKAIGPACYLFKLKRGVQNIEKVRDIILILAGYKLGSYCVHDKKSLKIAREYNRNINFKKKIKIYYIKPNERVKERPLYEGGVEYLANFIDVEEEIKPFVWDVVWRYLLVENSEIGENIAYKHRIPTVSYDMVINSPALYGIESDILRKRKSEYDNHFGIDDPNIINSRKESIIKEINETNQTLNRAFEERTKLNKSRTELLFLKENKGQIPLIEEDLIDKKKKLTSIKKEITNISKELERERDFQEMLKLVSEKNDALSQKLITLEANLDFLLKVKDYKDKIRELNSEMDGEDVVKIKNILNNLIVFKSVSEKLENLHKIFFRTLNDKLERLKKKRKDIYSKIWYKASRFPKIPKNHEFQISDISILEKEITKLNRLLPSLAGIDVKAREKLSKINKKIKLIQKKFNTNKRKSQNINKNLKKLSEDWGNEFYTKIKKIEKDTNELIEFLGLTIELTLEPLNIEDAELFIKVVNEYGKQINAESLSGGQKSTLNIALFLGANSFSDSKFYLLDELDQNLDPVSTKNVKLLLNKFSQDHQVLILSPAKDPQILKNSKLIFIDDNGNGAEIREINRIKNKKEKGVV